MIYYYKTVDGYIPHIRIMTHSFELKINVSNWFPNTKAKLNQLLKLLNEYDYEGKLPEILIQLSEDLKSKATFQYREVKSAKMFCRMLNSNISQIGMFGGKL